MRAVIHSIGAFTPVGLDAASTAAAVRAGVSRLRELPFYDQDSEPIVTAHVDDGELPRLSHAVAARGTTSERETRLVRLAAPALKEAVMPLAGSEPLRLFLSLPEVHPSLVEAASHDFLQKLAHQSSVSIDIAGSRTFRVGRAGGLYALAAGLEALASRQARHVVVGGVDTFQDYSLLTSLLSEGRISASGATDRMLPGEGAAFLVLGHEGTSGDWICSLDAIGLAEEPGHMHSTEIYRGDGLSHAFAKLFQPLPHEYPLVRTVYAGFNGSGFWAKEWGVALVRHRERFAESLKIEHPADCFGDAGAAVAPLLLMLASVAVERGYRQAPCLVFCSSDREARGVALLGGTNISRKGA